MLHDEEKVIEMTSYDLPATSAMSDDFAEQSRQFTSLMGEILKCVTSGDVIFIEDSEDADLVEKVLKENGKTDVVCMPTFL